ncbi:uncharacterized protein LOC100424132 isoform X3 [Macaca mulatta]
MPSDSFCLAAQARLDSKWLKTDIQFRACGQRRGGARQSGIPSDAVFRLRLPAQGLAIRSGQRPPEQPEADGGDPGQQRGRTEHRAVGRPVRAAERLVRAAAHRQGAGRVLSALLPCAVSGNDVNISPGRRFMIDLLVGSLMADGGLESALHAAITAEIQDIEAKKEAQKEKEIDEQEANASTFHRSRTPLDKDLINTGICESSGKQCLPLVQLIQQLLRLSAMARSWLTATSTSRVQVILLPQPVKQLGLQACATMPS